jgi:hypothetical protein
MSTDIPVTWIVTLCFLVSLVLSLWNLRSNLCFVDRILPAILQVGVLLIALTPTLHGHPRELFVPMILTFLWAVLAIASSYRLYHIRMWTFRILGVSQFVESAGMVLLGLFNYAGASYFWYGRLVLIP